MFTHHETLKKDWSDILVFVSYNKNKSTYKLILYISLSDKQHNDTTLSIDVYLVTKFFKLLQYFFRLHKLVYILRLISSNFVYTESDHFLLSNDVFFLIIENNIDQHINCININTYHLDTISAVTITIRSSKNDPEGISNTLCFHKNVVQEGSFDLCTSIYNWCILAKPIPNIPFLYYLNY